MMIAGTLFLFGIIIGLLKFTNGIVVIVSISVAITMIIVWTTRGEVGWMSVAVLFGYLLALQCGFLVGSFASADED